MIKPTCATSGKEHFWKCLPSTSGCFAFEKEDHKVRDFPTIASRRTKSNQVPPNVPYGGAPKGKARFYDIQAKGLDKIMMMMPVHYRFVSLVI